MATTSPEAKYELPPTVVTDQSEQAQPERIFNFKTKYFTSKIDFFNQLKNLVFVDKPDHLWSILTNKNYNKKHLLDALLYNITADSSITVFDRVFCSNLSAIEVSLDEFPELRKFYPDGTTHLLLKFSSLDKLWSLFAENFVKENDTVFESSDISLTVATCVLENMLNVKLDNSCFTVEFNGRLL